MFIMFIIYDLIIFDQQMTRYEPMTDQLITRSGARIDQLMTGETVIEQLGCEPLIDR